MTTKIISKNKFVVVQKNPTPCKKPRNNGGSPRGVKAPPTLATKKMKKITTCFFDVRHSFALNNGLINSMAAPVVPIQLANKVPTTKKHIFTIGLPRKEPLILTPPEIVKRASNRIMNGMYSNK